MMTRQYPCDRAFARRLDVGYLCLMRSNVVYARKQLEEWLEAVEKQPGFRSLYPQNEQIQRTNLEAAD